MTRPRDQTTLARKIVVVFDICSSTLIVEDLKSTDNLQCWRDLLIDLKSFLRDKSENLQYEIYKFVGDGWVLLFPPYTTKDILLDFLSDLMQAFYGYFDEHVSELLQRRPESLGITVGVDLGELIVLEMNEQEEYLGRAINVACRLQAATKLLPGGFSGKALFSKNAFNSMTGGREEFRVEEVRVPLRNISNGENYECFCWNILF